MDDKTKEIVIGTRCVDNTYKAKERNGKASASSTNCAKVAAEAVLKKLVDNPVDFELVESPDDTWETTHETFWTGWKATRVQDAGSVEPEDCVKNETLPESNGQPCSSIDLELVKSDLKKYEGTKQLLACEMTRGEYNEYRGWKIPENEDPTEDGYLVEYLDSPNSNHSNHENYISWSPSDVFEQSYVLFEEGEASEDDASVDALEFTTVLAKDALSNAQDITGDSIHVIRAKRNLEKALAHLGREKEFLRTQVTH